ncbi:MAG: hypothetical protein M1829_005603 [Trizodia sp. TS-e1964]|nr:MAG: hypothetical protein M1829_005603 [Trizodia sp. TS-e1964]
MSGYGNDRDRFSRDRDGQGPGRNRSRSPHRDNRRDDRRDDRMQTDSGYGNSSRGGRGGGRGGRGGFNDRGSGGDSFRSSLPDLPSEVPIPEGRGRIFPQPGFKPVGTVGQQTTIIVNHYEVQSLPIIKIYGYSFYMTVPVSSQRRGSDKVSAMQTAKVMITGAVKGLLGEKFVFDGVSQGWSPQEVIPNQEERTTTVDLPSHRPDKPNQVEITIRNNGPISIKGLVAFLRASKLGKNPMGDKEVEPSLKWLNALFRQDPASRFVTRPNANAYFERSKDTTFELRSTGGVLEAIRGVFQTVQIRFQRLTLNVDTATTAFWVPNKNLIEMICALAGVQKFDDIERSYLQNRPAFFAACGRLVGIYFQVKHLKSGEKKFKFKQWSKDGAAETVFDERVNGGEPRKTNVANYYMTKYNINLRFKHLPLAETNEGSFPLELCFSTDGERFKEPLQGAETADFIKFATSPATIRQKQIVENVKKLHWHELKVPTAHGLSMKTQMLQVPGQILPAPLPQYGRGTDRCAPDMGRWNLRNKQLLQPSKISSWGLIYFSSGRGVDEHSLQQFMRNMQMAFGSLGIQVPSKPPAYLIGNAHGDIKSMITDIMSKTANEFSGKPQLLFFLFSGANDRLYQGIKNTCDIQFGVATQVMLVEKSIGNQKGQQQYLANIGLKVNVKLGGINSIIVEPLFRKSKWMMLGGDVSHPSPGQLRMNPPPPSFSALAASWDKDCTAYSAVSSAQKGGEQIITDFPAMAQELLNRFREKNSGQFPESIIYFRDGTSESEFETIMAQEANPLIELFKSLPKAPKLTVIVCIKRHHTRMFPTERGDKLGNVLPGTVVENASDNDIFLVAHPGLQGTVRPTRYCSLLDQNKLSANDFQRITNNLCWTYARATTAVSVVPPVYYADQACERAKLHLRDTPQGGQILGQVHKSLTYSMYWQ